MKLCHGSFFILLEGKVSVVVDYGRKNWLVWNSLNLRKIFDIALLQHTLVFGNSHVDSRTVVFLVALGLTTSGIAPWRRHDQRVG
jgi:hypothetical protein